MQQKKKIFGNNVKYMDTIKELLINIINNSELVSNDGWLNCQEYPGSHLAIYTTPLNVSNVETLKLIHTASLNPIQKI
ncbi:hypothetical protein AQUCO_00400619v1 [Aquilegia coerulea]|uniref:Uncharacterized protein n=1 Tax=Aquilegia coerulea TaxID=218851 RepID=A0A2G5EW33_AQUCA|nr:hypothetical protein AQUCO_00400619v1 [Aquilegia coerulea]